MKKATFRVREIRTFEFDMYFDEYLSLANMEKAAEEKWWDSVDVMQQAREAEPVNVLVGIKRDEYGDIAVRRITNDSPWQIIRSMGEWQVSDGPVGERSVSYDFKTRKEAEEWIAAQQPTPDVKLFWANGSYCTTSGNMRDFNFAVRDVSLEGATRRAEQIIKGDGRRRYSGKLDMEVCAAGNY